jgi:uncharacterized protein YbjT (DUF2867 family)
MSRALGKCEKLGSKKLLGIEGTEMPKKISVLMLGASGAVGSEALKALLASPRIARVTSLGRRKIEAPPSAGAIFEQEIVDVFDPLSYGKFLPGHEAAICTLGMGQPSQGSREDYVRTDKDCVLAFAAACKSAGVRHFELLGAVGADPGSLSFYLKVKGELEEGLKVLDFSRLSLFRPSMILTPVNRYGLSQGVTLAAWPRLDWVLWGPLRKARGIRVEELGRAMALNLLREGKPGAEILHWDEFKKLNA